MAKGSTFGPRLDHRGAIKLKWNDAALPAACAVGAHPCALRDGSLLVVRGQADVRRAKAVAAERKAKAAAAGGGGGGGGGGAGGAVGGRGGRRPLRQPRFGGATGGVGQDVVFGGGRSAARKEVGLTIRVHGDDGVGGGSAAAATAPER